MTRRSTGAISTWWALGWVGAGLACGGDQVQPGDNGGAGDGGRTSSADAAAKAGGMSSPSGADAVAPFEDAGMPTNPGCNVTGRWLVAMRVLADAIGQKQASHNWFYYEMNQSADQVTVTKGLHCGYEVVPITSLGASVDSHLAWPGILSHDSDTGRKGTMEVTGSSCRLSIEKRYTVRGATVSFYSDPNQPMPTVSQKAAGTTPGWEDWDMDGNPGITLVVSEGGSNLGNLYCAQRDWNAFDGAVVMGSAAFSVSTTWGSEQDALGYTGSNLVTQMADPDSDPAQNFAWFVRLSATQATGDDTAVCAAVRALVPTLAPATMN